MNNQLSIEKARAFLDSYFADGTGFKAAPRPKKLPAITISRQSGAGGLSVAEFAADLLQKVSPKRGVTWAVFDKNLVELVLADLRLPGRLASVLPENQVSGISSAIEELFGLHPAEWTMVQKTSETILNLATLGGVIIVGRGANVITASLDNVFHVRLVGSLDRRVERIMKRFELSAREARHRIGLEDKGRARYLKKHFGEDIDNPLLYHLIINTDQIDCPETARMVVDHVVKNYF